MSRSTARQGHKSRWKARDAKYREEHRTRRREKREKLVKHTIDHPGDLEAWDALVALPGSRKSYQSALAQYVDEHDPDPTPEVEPLHDSSSPNCPQPSETAVWDAELGTWVEEIEL